MFTRRSFIKGLLAAAFSVSVVIRGKAQDFAPKIETTPSSRAYFVGVDYGGKVSNSSCVFVTHFDEQKNYFVDWVRSSLSHDEVSEELVRFKNYFAKHRYDCEAIDSAHGFRFTKH